MRTRADSLYLYRGEMTLAPAPAEAIMRRMRGCLGKNLLGTGMDLDIILFVGAGAYLAKRQQASGVASKRGQPHLKPPFPATVVSMAARR
jgi:NADH-quinone oxidoreductase subunit F